MGRSRPVFAFLTVVVVVATLCVRPCQFAARGGVRYLSVIHD